MSIQRKRRTSCFCIENHPTCFIQKNKPFQTRSSTGTVKILTHLYRHTCTVLQGNNNNKKKKKDKNNNSRQWKILGATAVVYDDSIISTLDENTIAQNPVDKRFSHTPPLRGQLAVQSHGKIQVAPKYTTRKKFTERKHYKQ